MIFTNTTVMAMNIKVTICIYVLYIGGMYAQIQQMANIFYQKLKCLLSFASKLRISPQKCTMCGSVFSSWYHGKFTMSKLWQIHVMCVKALSAQFWHCKFTAISHWIHSNVISMVPFTHGAFFIMNLLQFFYSTIFLL